MHRPDEDIVGLRAEYDFANYDDAFVERYVPMDREVVERIRAAKEILPRIDVTDEICEQIVKICMDYGTTGLRGQRSCVQVARAVAALHGHEEISEDDLLAAVFLSLDHRRKFVRKFEKNDYIKPDYNPTMMGLRLFIHVDRPLNRKKADAGSSPKDAEDVVDVSAGIDDGDTDLEELSGKVQELFDTIDLLKAVDSNGDLADENLSKKSFETDEGRYTSSMIPRHDDFEIALDATIRAAAMRQRADAGTRISIEKGDFREKVRTKHLEATFMFVLDTSGSLIIRNRLAKVKTLIVSMLKNHYANRDRVGLMTFNGENMEILMEPTRATETLSKTIDDIKVGCGTPLSEAFVFLHDYLAPYLKKHPNELCHIVLVTDGKATISLNPERDPFEEAVEVAKFMNLKNTDWILIDTGLGTTKNQNPHDLAEALGGRFFLLDNLKTAEDTADF